MADGRKSNGGARKGAGRKSIHEEIAARDIAIEAIIDVYGSLEDGMKALLASPEPSLRKFVFEHAFGKPMEKVQHSGDPDAPITFKTDERFLT